MSKQTKTDSFTAEPTSFEDAGYKLARTGEVAANIAQFALSRCPTILDEVPKEVKAGLYAGFQLRKHELTGDKYYKLGEGGNYIPLESKPDDSVKGVVCMTINAAMSYSQQEYGKMRESDPAKHAIIRPLRDAFSDYAGNCLRDLKAAIRKLQNQGKTRERGANKGFREAMSDIFDKYEARVKTAKDRGDAAADPVKFKLAVSAFWKTYDA